jgi:hypothetical protein
VSFTFRPYKPTTHPPMRSATREELVVGQWYKRFDSRGHLRTVWLRSVSECGRYAKFSIGDRVHGPTHDCATSSLHVWVNQCRPELGHKPEDKP